MELIDIGKLPILYSDNPAGLDVRTEDIYEQLASEINKRVAVTTDGVVDWGRVVKLSQDILQNYSKDILVCSYLCIGLFNTSGLKGFAIGLHIYSDLIKTYWANLFPPRINGRINAINWWVNTVNEQLRKIKGETWSEEEVANLNQDFETLIQFLVEHEVEQSSDIRMMQSGCRNLISIESVTTTSVANTLPGASSSSNQEQQLTKNSSAVTTTIAAVNTESVNTSIHAVAEEVILPDNINPDDIGRALAPVFGALDKISAVIYEKHPLSYILFRINRFCAWINITSVPPSDNDGKTLLAPPEDYLLSFAQKLYQERKWLELLKYAEVRIVEYRFWLDLSYYVYTALINLNELSIANELAYETLIFIKRVSGVEKLFFSNGMPFAANETLEWIDGLDGNQDRDNTAAKLINDDEKWKSAIEEAKQLFNNGDLSGALNKLHYRIQSAQTKRDRFLRILYFCQFVNNTKQSHLAKPYIYELLDSSSKYQLETWEPTLVSEVYQLILTIARQKKIKFSDDNIEDILNRLTVIDPINSLKFYNK